MSHKQKFKPITDQLYVKIQDRLVIDQLRGQLKAQLNGQLANQLHNQLYDQLYWQLYNQTSEVIRDETKV